MKKEYIQVAALSLVILFSATSISSSLSQNQLAAVSGAGSGLILHLPFDDGGAAGKVGQAKQFDGVDDFVQLSSNLPSLTSFTLAGWMKLNPSAALQQNGRNPFWSLDGSNRLMFNVSGNSYLALNNTTFNKAFPLGSDVWVHMAFVRNETNVDVYKNGALLGAWNVGDTATPFANSRLGEQGTGYHLDGFLDDVRLYDRPLSVSEIGELVAYGGSSGGTTEPPPPNPPPPTEEPVNTGPTVFGSTVTARTCTAADVQAAIDTSKDGDVVVVPAGNCSWVPTTAQTGAVNINNKSITLKGGGMGQTNITLTNAPGYNQSAIRVAMVDDKPFRITGFTFNGDGYYAYVVVSGNSKSFRIDHISNKADTPRATRLIATTGTTYGVIDHVLSMRGAGIGSGMILVRGADIPANLSGNTDWRKQPNLGGVDAVFIEDSEFIGQSGLSSVSFAIDVADGGKVVVRNNKFLNQESASHGAQSSGGRGAKTWEIYNNHFKLDYSVWAALIFLRGGTGVIFNNTFERINGGYGHYIAFDNPRSHAVYSWSGGKCDGTNQWDGNSEANGYPCLDQIGRGSGDPKNQTLYPAYEWNNKVYGTGADVDVTVTNPPSDIHIKEGRDYYNDACLSGYTPYAYPHPIVQKQDGVSAAAISLNCPTSVPPPTGNSVQRISSAGSILATFTTIKECAAVVQAGETCLIGPGTYSESVNITRSGNSSGYITFKGAAGSRPILRGDGAANQAFLIGGYNPSHGQDYIWIENLEITNYGSDGIRAVWANGAGNNNIVLKNLDIHDVVWNGIYLGGSGGNWTVDNVKVTNVGGHCLKFAEYDFNNIHVTNNTLTDCGMYSGNTDATRASYGIQVSYMDAYKNAAVDNITIKNNKINGSWQASINVNTARNGIVIEGNELRNAWKQSVSDLGTGMGALQIGLVSTNPFSLTAKNNIIDGSAWRGVSLTTNGGTGSSFTLSGNEISNNKREGIYSGPGASVAVSILNNTLYNNAQTAGTYAVHFPYRVDSAITFKNNIIYNLNSNLAIFSDRKLFSDVFDYNLYAVGDATASTKIVLFNQVSWNAPWTLSQFQAQSRELRGKVGKPIFSTGLKPSSSSPSCGMGEGGTDVGAYTCGKGSVINVAGDFNKDGFVNSIDFSLMAGAWNTSNATYDLNEDTTVNTLDYSIMAQNWTR